MREMKDSGIEWIGEIPQRWKKINLKYICDFKTGGTPQNKKGIDIEGDYKWITPADFIDSYCITNSNQYISAKAIADNGYTLFPTNSVLLVCIASVGKVGIIDKPSYSNQQITALKPNNLSYSKYLMYSLVAATQKIQFDASSNVVPIVNTKYLQGFTIPFPAIAEQRMIADFLDAKCAEIDALIADIQTQIDTLEQYKRSVITKAVTRGVNTDVEMKDSGIEWIGEIPATWNIHPVYSYFGERKNKNSLGNENNLLSLSYGRVIRRDINANSGLLPESFNTYNIVEAGDIIIRPTDLQNDKRSLRTGLVKEHGIITSAYIDLRPIKHVDSRFFHYLLHAYDVMKVFYNMGNGVRQGLNYLEFSKLMVFEPSYAEQVAIANYLDKKISAIDIVLEKKKQQSEVLGQYKKSLIYEYVTGKKEVPANA